MPRYILVHLTSPDTVPGGSPHNEIGDAYFSASLGKPSAAIGKGLYKASALIEAKDPEDLFSRTQNIDAPWTERTKPIYGDLRQRSTSVGDFIVNLDTPEVLLCASVGWEPADVASEDAIRDVATKAYAQGIW